MADCRLVCDAGRVAFEDVDGEIIAIDFASGAYFSLQKTAAEIWRYLIAGAGPVAIEAAAANAAGDAAAARQAVRGFVDRLIDTRLLAAGTVPAEPIDVFFADFEAPLLEQFEDMAELIQLDPIHEVTEAGWPHMFNP